ncbi:MAG: glycosyltransferase family 2 protein [Bacteroidales bacterium]
MEMNPKISGFTYVRNGLQYGYPFIASIQSVLPIVDELIVVVGDSNDGTREAIVNLQNSKIKIIDTVWDEENRRNGSIFAMQSNIGLQQITGDWALHIQADEVLHQKAAEQLQAYIKIANQRPDVDALVFPFLHFWGDYKHIRNTRGTHPYEVRAFKNNKPIFSYRDSQGFRAYSSYEAYLAGEEGCKLRSLKTEIDLYHYSYCRSPKLLKKKHDYAQRFWHDDQWIKENITETPFDFNEVDRLDVFQGEHPLWMKEIIAKQDWDFKPDPSKWKMSIKNKLLSSIEKCTHKRWFSYQNYKIV